MSTYASLVCPSKQRHLWLGEPLRHPDGTVFAYDRPTDDRFAPVLWAFLEDCADEDLRIVPDGTAEFEEIADWPEIGGDAVGDIPFDDVLAGSPAEPTRYVARLRPGLPVTEASGVVRRRGDGPDAVDEAFTRALRWEPTEFLRRQALGLEDGETADVDGHQAANIVLKILTKRLQQP